MNKYDEERDALGPVPDSEEERNAYWDKYDEIDAREEAEWKSNLPELDKKFLEVQAQVEAQIKEKLQEASDKLDEAVKLSNEHGIPFHSYISFLGQGYRPPSFDEKWSEISQVKPRNLHDYDGWEHSAVCY